MKEAIIISIEIVVHIFKSTLSHPFFKIAMFQNYLKIALRNLARQKGYSAINIIGLALGLATCLLIALYVTDELSYDGFHANKDRIYRIISGLDNNQTQMFRANLTPPKLASYLKENHNEVEMTARFLTAVVELKRGTVVIQPNEANAGISADASFFKMFSFPILFGNPVALEKSPTSIVLTRSVAISLFGENHLEKAIGQTIEVMKTPCTVVAILQDIPRNSHLNFAFAIPLEHQPNHEHWESNILTTYIMLKSGTNWHSMNEKVVAMGEKIISPAFRKYNAAWSYKQELQPLTDIRLHSNLTSEKGTAKRVQIFGLVGILVLLLACINYANLSTARSMLRSREVGVRKTFGATRFQVMLQFFGEALGVVFVAFLLAIVLVEIALPLFNTLSGKQFIRPDVFQVRFFAVAAGIFLVTVFSSGGYAALVLSSFRPSEALTSRTISSGRRGNVRRILVVGQFVISTALIIGVLVINAQLRYMNTASLGFNKQQLVSAHFNSLFDKQEAILNEMKRLPGVEDAGATMQCPVLWTGAASVNVSSAVQKEARTISSDVHFTSFDFAKVMQIPLIEGRFFERGRDSANSFVVNASFAKAMGWENPIGQTVRFTLDTGEMTGVVIGVVGDIHAKSLHSSILPVIYRLNRRAPIMLLRLKTENISQTISSIEKLYSSFKPEFPLELKFLDAEFAKLYADDENLAQTLMAITIVAIVIASLGLFGLAAFAAERRTKEIGIRKVLGASVASIIALLSKDFLKLVGIAIVLATPLAYWAAGKWLQDFAYRVELSWWVFASAGAAAVAIAFLTVAGQSWRAAEANPVQSLRSE
ncbi:MAG: FtsX-like permease family protein [Candidatus Kapaibacterium sp.]|nr:MAG: FtsX-like permease family protein [Candidatus Kapabacteria bacterium]